jgi:hypothetical protein
LPTCEAQQPPQDIAQLSLPRVELIAGLSPKCQSPFVLLGQIADVGLQVKAPIAHRTPSVY